VAAQVSKDYARAEFYASECSEIRKMAKIVIGSEIALERAIIRLQTVDQLREVLFLVTPVVTVIEETKGKIEGIIPEVASELATVHALLDDTIKDTGMVLPRETELVLDYEAEKIFEESSTYAEQKIREQFPDLPLIQQTPIADDKTVILEREGADAVVEFSSDETRPHTSKSTFEMKGVVSVPGRRMEQAYSQVYEYILDQGRQSGKLSLTECAKTLGLEKDDVLGAVKTLRKEGRIVFLGFHNLDETEVDDLQGDGSNGVRRS